MRLPGGAQSIRHALPMLAQSNEALSTNCYESREEEKMSIAKVILSCTVLLLLSAAPAFAADACSLLTPAEIESALGAKVTQTIPSVVPPETGCVYKLDKDQVVLSYFTDPAHAANVKSMKEDPFMRGGSGPNVKDYGNTGCKVIDAAILFSTNCNHYQPRWLHIAVQFHPPKHAASMDTVKTLLDKAASRLK